MKIIISVFAFILLLPSVGYGEGQRSFEDIYHIDNKSAERVLGKTTCRRLKHAVDDFNAVISGRKPLHAKFDDKQPLPADGGTTYYIGDGYKITIVKSLDSIKHGSKFIYGYMYGPIITFDDDLISGNHQTISYVTFYPDERLMKLLMKKESQKVKR